MQKTAPEIAKEIQVPEYSELLSRIKRRYDKVGRNMPIMDMELARIQMIADVIDTKTAFIRELNKLIKNLDPFYKELVLIEFDEEKIRKYVDCIYRARKLAKEFAKKYKYIIMAQDKHSKIKKKAAEARGRMLSPIKRCSKGLLYLKNVVVYISKLPSIDPRKPTLIIAGAPSVGKSSFVASASRARIEVAEYPFTTKQIHVGHTEIQGITIQLIDTPGLLDRRPEERNEIEKRAIAALKHINGIIVFLIDPTETATIPVGNQLEVALGVNKLVKDRPIVYVLTKTDLLNKRKLENITEFIKQKTGQKPYWVVANNKKSVENLVKQLIQRHWEILGTTSDGETYPFNT